MRSPNPVHDYVLELCLSGVDDPEESRRAESVGEELGENGWMRDIAWVVGEEIWVAPESSPLEDLIADELFEVKT